MKTDFRWTLAALALFVTACDKQASTEAPAGGNAAAAVAAPAGQDWTETVVATPEGGFRMGNPDAPVKLVEYASLTCPHCAEFAREGVEALKANYIRTGKVNLEFRSFLLNPVDAAASLVVVCQGPGPVFKLIDQLYADQQTWGTKFSTVPEAEVQRISALPETERFEALAKAGGLDQFFAARGIPQAKIQACLADKAALDRLVQLRERGVKEDGVTGTPTFLINGKLVDGAFNWATLEPKLREALGG